MKAARRVGATHRSVRVSLESMQRLEAAARKTGRTVAEEIDAALSDAVPRWPSPSIERNELGHIAERLRSLGDSHEARHRCAGYRNTADLPVGEQWESINPGRHLCPVGIFLTGAWHTAWHASLCGVLFASLRELARDPDADMAKVGKTSYGAASTGET